MGHLLDLYQLNPFKKLSEVLQLVHKYIFNIHLVGQKDHILNKNCRNIFNVDVE